MPFEGGWVQCDVCGRWCHGECAGMDLQQAEEAEGYICPLCEAGAGPAEAEGLRLHLSSSNSTGYKNVFKQASGRFWAQHTVDGGQVHIGTFDTAVEAAVAYARAVGQAEAAGLRGPVWAAAAAAEGAEGAPEEDEREARTRRPSSRTPPSPPPPWRRCRCGPFFRSHCVRP